MSSVFIRSVIASGCQTEFTGPSEIATVKGLPSVCSIATPPKTYDEAVMTSSDSLHPRGTTEKGTEYTEPEKNHPQKSGALRTAAGFLGAAGAFAAVHYIHTGVFKPGWLEGRNREEGKWSEEEWKEGEEAERKALGLSATVQGARDEEEANSKEQMN